MLRPTKGGSVFFSSALFLQFASVRVAKRAKQCTFMAMGIDELSVTPTAVLPLRAAIRKSIAKTCTLELLNS